MQGLEKVLPSNAKQSVWRLVEPYVKVLIVALFVPLLAQGFYRDLVDPAQRPKAIAWVWLILAATFAIETAIYLVRGLVGPELSKIQATSRLGVFVLAVAVFGWRLWAWTDFQDLMWSDGVAALLIFAGLFGLIRAVQAGRFRRDSD